MLPRSGAVAAVSVAAFIWGTTELRPTESETTESVIVQAASLDEAAAAVEAVGVEMTHELGIINAVGAELTSDQRSQLSQVTSLRVHADREATVAQNGQGGNNQGGGGPATAVDTHYPALVEARQLHEDGIYGQGATIAVIDTGLWHSPSGLVNDTTGNPRVSAHYDAIENESQTGGSGIADGYGHGTHVSAVALSSGTFEGMYEGIAPGAHLVLVRAFDDLGRGRYADVIRGLDWVVANKDTYDIRVLNLSFSAPPQSHYWDDPLNQAVMRAWQAGIVVVGYANQGLDIDADLNGTAHFGGRAAQDADGNYYLEGLNGYMWNDGFMWNDGNVWTAGYDEAVPVNKWVDQE